MDLCLYVYALNLVLISNEHEIIVPNQKLQTQRAAQVDHIQGL